MNFIKKRNKFFMFIFSFIGVLSGLCLTLATITVMTSHEWQILTNAANSDFTQIKIEPVKRILVLILLLGQTIFWFSLIGFVAVAARHKHALTVYAGYIVIATLIAFYLVIGLMFRADSVQKIIHKNAQALWLINFGLFRSWTQKFQENHHCCGWFNAFDYCTKSNLGNLIYTQVRQGDLETMVEEMTDIMCDLDPDYCVGVGLMGIDLDYDYYSYDYDDVSEDYLELMESCDAQDDSPANSEKCACFKQRYTNAVGSYFEMPCYTNLTTKETVRVEEVCPQGTCHLHGCEFEFKRHIRRHVEEGTSAALFLVLFYLLGAGNLLYVASSISNERKKLLAAERNREESQRLPNFEY